MKTRCIVACLLFATLYCPCFGQQASKPQQVPANPELFLSDDDVGHVMRALPGLADASQQGPDQAASYLATLDISLDQLNQKLSNISIAYSVIKFNDWMKEIKLDSKPSAYGKLVEASQHQLDQITAKYKSAKQGGQSALDANEAVVRRHLSDVELLMVHLQRTKPSSLPVHP